MVSRSNSARSDTSLNQKFTSRQSVVFILTDQKISLADNEHLDSLQQRGTKPLMTVPISRMPWRHTKSLQLPECEQDPSPEQSYPVNIRLDRIASHMKWKRFTGQVGNIKVYSSPILVY